MEGGSNSSMSTKTYWLKFGSGDPRPNTGLSPTFLQFFDNTGATQLAPAIAEIKYGGATASGLYGFSYLISATQSIYFLAYSVTAVSSGIASDEYITGVIDPILAIDQNVNGVGVTMTAIGVSSLALGNTILSINQIGSSFVSYIGSTASSFGTTSVDPSTIFGYLKRLQELLEGDQTFAAGIGQWQLYNRGALGTTTLLRVKNILNNGALVTKSGD